MPEPAVLVDIEPGAPDPGGLRRAAYDEILTASFTPEELFSYDELAADHTMVVAVRDGTVVAVGVSDPGEDGGIVLLSYLAVRPGLRGGGLGGAVLAHMGERWRAQGAGLAVGEIHDPRCHPEGPDEKPAARLRFYERAGAELVGPWVQPALEPGMPRVDGMLLIVFHRAGTFGGARLPSAPIVAWIESYYRACEGGGADDGLARLLPRYTAPEGLAVLPLGRYADLPTLQPG